MYPHSSFHTFVQNRGLPSVPLILPCGHLLLAKSCRSIYWWLVSCLLVNLPIAKYHFSEWIPFTLHYFSPAWVTCCFYICRWFHFINKNVIQCLMRWSSYTRWSFFMLRLFCRWWFLHMWVGNWSNQWCGGCYGFWSFVIVLTFFCLNDMIWCIMLRSCWSYWNHRDTWYNGCRFLNSLQTNHIFINHNIFSDDNFLFTGL